LASSIEKLPTNHERESLMISRTYHSIEEAASSSCPYCRASEARVGFLAQSAAEAICDLEEKERQYAKAAAGRGEAIAEVQKLRERIESLETRCGQLRSQRDFVEQRAWAS
jgi:chromosome segregation ATPase